ncbi:hypothetical protein MJG53_004830 [Ovis ammon polii x Ovis aries]|uniref:Uncharacterized protein n=1 Tax=Ovis ammon polii x Ovis aries TaxID=2918886 RepID=A0ACB9VB36_9CETA|nr:hypothetical protein MJG53_004830 [Ovis ammon polii x Ovis aries]
MEPAASKLFPGRRGNDQLEADTNFPCPLTPTPVSWHTLEVVHGRAELLLREILCKTSMHFRAGFSMDELAWLTHFSTPACCGPLGYGIAGTPSLRFIFFSDSQVLTPKWKADDLPVFFLIVTVNPVGYLCSSGQLRLGQCGLGLVGQLSSGFGGQLGQPCFRLQLELRNQKPSWICVSVSLPWRTLMHTHLSLGKQMNPILLEHLSKRRVNKCGAAFIFLYIKVP